MGGEMRRAKSLRNGVHHANAVVWGPVCRTHLKLPARERGDDVQLQRRHPRLFPQQSRYPRDIERVQLRVEQIRVDHHPLDPSQHRPAEFQHLVDVLLVAREEELALRGGRRGGGGRVVGDGDVMRIFRRAARLRVDRRPRSSARDEARRDRAVLRVRREDVLRWRRTDGRRGSSARTRERDE
eukprot:31527-Pelagococcus_subviridis.AAC.3